MKKISRLYYSFVEIRIKTFVFFLFSILYTTISLGAVTADFSASPTTICIGQSTVFTNLSSGSITTYSWDFGTGASPATANTAGPHTVTYNSSGSKTITLTVSGPGGTATTTKTNYVNVGKDRIKIMSYNLLNYPDINGSSFSVDTALRNPFYRTTISSANPDILVIQELLSQAGLTGFLSNVMNASSNQYSAGTYINSYDTDNGILYKTSKFTFVSNTPIATDLRDINEFKLVHKLSGDTLRIYSVHLKASNTPPDEAQRALEIDSLRKVTNALPAGSNFIVCGDFNIYYTLESCYQKLIEVVPGKEGQFIDPITMSGAFWNNSANALYHTQSPRIRAFGGGSTGGMDDRFDLILYSKAISLAGGMTYVANSTIAYGNDGNHYNDSINQMPNTAVSQAVADALHNGSDHIPVVATFEFENTTCSFTDFGAIALLAPSSPTCSNPAQPLQVQVKNYGTSQVDFSLNNLQVVLDVINPFSTTTSFNKTISTGVLNPGSLLTVTFNSTLDMSTPGIYTFNAHTIISGDTAFSNNSMLTVTTTVASNTTASINANGNTNFCSGGSVLLTANTGTNITYQWQKNGTNISGATGQNFSVTQSGSYTAVLQQTTNVTSNYPSATFTNSNALGIPDNNCTGATSTINVSGYTGNVTSSGISVKINVSHFSVGDLVVFLEAPNGDRLGLANRVGGTGDNFTNTIFSDGGATQIPLTGAPFTSTYKPWTTLFTACVASTKTTFASIGSGSINPNGNWKLLVYDQSNLTAGTVTNWQITFPAYSSTSTIVCDPVTSSPISVTVNQPFISFNPSSPSVCSGASVTIVASGASTYSWSPSTGLNLTTGSSVVANPTSLTVYTVVGTDGIGCSITSTVTVSISQSASVTMSPLSNVCLNTPAFNLSGGQPSGGNYSGTGVSNGIFSPSSAGTGTYTITYSYNNGGCSGTASSTITVNPLPVATVSPPGPISICQGNAVQLSAPPASTYAWSNGPVTQTNSINTAGNYSVTVTDDNGCSSTSTPVNVSVSTNQIRYTLFYETMGPDIASPPDAISTHETNNRFDNDDLTMSGTGDVRNSVVLNQFSNSAGALIFLTQTAGKNFIISGINTTGMSNIQLTFGIQKNLTASDGSDFLVQVSDNGAPYTNLSYTLPTGSGTTAWHYVTPTGTIPSTSNLIIQFYQNASIYQYRIDDISLTYSITIPAITVTGPTDFCQGSSVLLTAPGSSSYLWNTGATTQSLTVASTGSYVSTLTGNGGCSASTNVVFVNAKPKLFSTTGGGSYCSGGSGVPIGLSGSETGVTYQLKNGSTSIGSPLAGNGNALNFGNQSSSGTYTVTGTNASAGCTATMTGSVNIVINPLPNLMTITGGGSYCQGGTGLPIGLSSSQTGVGYELLLNGITTGNITIGTGASISFGNINAAGSYSVIATNTSTGCTRTMTGTVSIFINPVPLSYSLTGGGDYCSGGNGVLVGLNNSESGIQYQLQINNINSGLPVTGNGSPVSFGNQTTAGNYTVLASNTSTGCSSSMSNSVTVNVLPKPLVYNVTGGGSYCADPGDGVVVGLNNSQNGVQYQLYLNNSVAVGPVINGNGLPLSFGNQVVPGNYSVIAMNTTTLCGETMNGNAEVIRFEVSNWYHDGDGDGYGNPTNIISACSQPSGYISDNTDCNDLNSMAYPGANEICFNGIDDNCNNLIDENCYTTFQVKLFIEGYYLGSSSMRSVIDPAGSPLLCDTIILKLASPNSPYSFVYSDTAIINTNGTASFMLHPNVVSGNSFYLVLVHRNALQTWSSSPFLFNQSSMAYDFSTSAASAFGNNLKNLGDGNFALFSGDVNHDGQINTDDLNLIETSTQNFITGYKDTDLNGDNVNESADYSLVENNLRVILLRP